MCVCYVYRCFCLRRLAATLWAWRKYVVLWFCLCWLCVYCHRLCRPAVMPDVEQVCVVFVFYAFFFLMRLLLLCWSLSSLHVVLVSVVSSCCVGLCRLVVLCWSLSSSLCWSLSSCRIWRWCSFFVLRICIYQFRPISARQVAGFLAYHCLPFPPSFLCRSLCYSVVSVFVCMFLASCLLAVCVFVCFTWVAVLLAIRPWIFLVPTRNLSFKNNIWAIF